MLLRRGMDKGEPTARLTHVLGLARQQFPTLRRRSTKWTGHGTSANNRPPIIACDLTRDGGAARVGRDYAHTRTCEALTPGAPSCGQHTALYG
jgi:hypothetical protein